MTTLPIALIYNPKALEYPSNNPVAFRYAKPVAKAGARGKSKPIGLSPMEGPLLTPGLNWIKEADLEGIKSSEKGAMWLENGVLRILPKRPLAKDKDGDVYVGNLTDYLREEGHMEYASVKIIISNTWNRGELVTIKSQAPGMFKGNGAAIVSKACDEQIKKIDTQFGETVDASQFYKGLSA